MKMFFFFNQVTNNKTVIEGEVFKINKNLQTFSVELSSHQEFEEF